MGLVVHLDCALTPNAAPPSHNATYPLQTSTQPDTMARMEAHEKEAMLADLHCGREALLAVLSGVTEEEATWRPGPGRWSVLDCVEHVAVSEDYLLSQIRAAQPTATTTRNEQREALIATRGLDRTRPVP